MRPNTLRSLRRYHHYLGMFFAPYILLFAVSGALQTFRLPEAKGYGGPPPQWMVWLAAVHKDQSPPREAAPERPKAAAAASADTHDDDHHEEATPPAATGRPNPLPLKIFVVLLAVALAISTIIGVTIGLANRAMRPASIALLVIGFVLPGVLLWV